ncbi:MAG: hypothetical protein K6F49_13200 [Saccharofermentans sp.]|nr:hypothetical protein [Saccharofermentans sp.]
MIKLRTISILLIISVLMSLGGCTPREAREKVRETVDAYAQAVITGDTEELARHIEEKQEFKEEIEDYLVRVTGNEDLDEVFDFVLSNITYEIDEDSIAVSGKEARADISYTLIDYEGVYEDFDTAPSITEYTEALSENTDRRISLSQEIDLIFTEGEWKIAGDDSDNITEVYGFYEDISGYEWSTMNRITDIEFESALNTVFGVSSTQYSAIDYSDHTEVVFYDDTAFLAIYIFDSEDDAASMYAEVISPYSGSSDLVDSFFEAYGPDNSETVYDGYVILDGTDNPYVPIDGPFHGGIYQEGDTIVFALVNEDGISRLDSLYDFLDALGLPTD